MYVVYWEVGFPNTCKIALLYQEEMNKIDSIRHLNFFWYDTEEHGCSSEFH
jgi:hypothetical protein